MTDNAKSPILSKNVSSSIGLEPNLRFSEFDALWNKIPFRELVSEYNNKTRVEDEDVLLSSAIDGVFLNSELFGHQRGSSNIGYKKISMYTLILSTQNLHLGNANVNTRFEHGMVSPAYKTYEIRNCNKQLFSLWIKSEKAKRFFYNATTVGASQCRRNVEWDSLYEQEMILPSLAEQQKIADFLSLVDQRIEKQQQLVEVLKRYKRGLLSLVFKGNFQMVKLADICDFVSSSHTISNLGARESGIYPVYDAAGLSMYIDTYDMHEEYISIVKDGSGIGRLQKCDKNSSFIGTLGALVAKNCEIDYLFAVLQTIDFSRFATGMAIPHIYYKDYKNTLIPLPSQDTQKNISRLFRNIDIHIEQNSIQLDKILVLKHGLLQQMFI